jgi:hypothetical protein
LFFISAVGSRLKGHETSNLSTAPAKPSRRFLSSSWAPSWVKEAPDPLFNAALQELRLDVAAPPLICLPSVTPTCVEALRRTAGYGTTFMWLRCCWVVAAAQDGAHRGAVRERAPHPAQRRRVQHHRLRPGRTRLVRELMLLVLPSPPGRGRRPVPRVVVVRQRPRQLERPLAAAAAIIHLTRRRSSSGRPRRRGRRRIQAVAVNRRRGEGGEGRRRGSELGKQSTREDQKVGAPEPHFI